MSDLIEMIHLTRCRIYRGLVNHCITHKKSSDGLWKGSIILLMHDFADPEKPKDLEVTQSTLTNLIEAGLINHNILNVPGLSTYPAGTFDNDVTVYGSKWEQGVIQYYYKDRQGKLIKLENMPKDREERIKRLTGARKVNHIKRATAFFDQLILYPNFDEQQQLTPNTEPLTFHTHKIKEEA